MSHAVLDYLVWQMAQCFQDKPEHSLMANLSSVIEDDLDRLPPGGGRTMRDLIVHCASVTRMHTNHAFGDRSMTWWTTWDGEGALPDANLEGLVDWLRRANAEAIAAVQQLPDDAALLDLRYTHWGEEREARLIIDAVLIHDVFHAGEINHLRGLLQSGGRK